MDTTCCYIDPDAHEACTRKAIFDIQFASNPKNLRDCDNNTQACERHYQVMRESLEDELHPIDQETGEIHECPVSEIPSRPVKAPLVK